MRIRRAFKRSCFVIVSMKSKKRVANMTQVEIRTLDAVVHGQIDVQSVGEPTAATKERQQKAAAGHNNSVSCRTQKGTDSPLLLVVLSVVLRIEGVVNEPNPCVLVGKNAFRIDVLST
ncbi:hypothetical protein HDU80_004242 [Chytriomyces hyalinus]|nr:hypothetical protein HDU80_004242 [Chytriomyces hyalinus]